MIKFKFYIYKEIFHNNYFKLFFISFTLVWKLQQNRRVFNRNLCCCFAESRWSLISQMFFLPTILKSQYFKWAPRCSKISFYCQEGKSDAFFYFDRLFAKVLLSLVWRKDTTQFRHTIGCFKNSWLLPDTR